MSVESTICSKIAYWKDLLVHFIRKQRLEMANIELHAGLGASGSRVAALPVHRGSTFTCHIAFHMNSVSLQGGKIIGFNL
jgi:hypothetical protein